MCEVAVRVDVSRGLAVLTWPDIEPAFAVWQEAITRLLASPGFQRHYGVVADWRRVSRAPAAPLVESAVSFVASLRSQGLLQGRWATVVDHEQLHMFGMGRMTEIKASLQDVPHRLFTDLAAALAWAETAHSS